MNLIPRTETETETERKNVDYFNSENPSEMEMNTY